MLVDMCAERTYICQDLVQKIKLKRYKTDVQILGVNGITGKSKAYVNLIIALKDEKITKVRTTALVVSVVTGKIPQYDCDLTLPDSSKVLALADPNFFKPGFVGAKLNSLNICHLK